MPNKIDQLIAHFEKFPGVGARQARRFAFHALSLPDSDLQNLATLIAEIKQNTTKCQRCYRFFTKEVRQTSALCNICSDPNRDQQQLLVIAVDNDLNAIEKSRHYRGLYFVLGGTVPLINHENQKKLRGEALKARLEEQLQLKQPTEVILGFAVNPDGENTTRYVESLIKQLDKETKLKITQLGRGLSTGSEIEYADPETINDALSNRR